MIPEIIFLDMDRPIMNGFEFIDEYRKLEEEIKNQIKIVMLSSSVNPHDEEKSKTIPEIIGFLHKPLGKKHLHDLCMMLPSFKNFPYWQDNFCPCARVFRCSQNLVMLKFWFNDK